MPVLGRSWISMKVSLVMNIYYNLDCEGSVSQNYVVELIP